MQGYSIGEIIEMAVQTERLGYLFYTEMAERFAENQRLAKLFGTLALKEKRHEAVYLELKEITGEEEPEGWEEAQKYFRAFVESEFFLGSRKSLPSMQRLKTVEEAVDFALGFEKETLLYFLGLRDAVGEKDVVDEIINEEKSHIMWLNDFKASF